MACVCTNRPSLSASMHSFAKFSGLKRRSPILPVLLYGTVIAALCDGYSTTPSANTFTPGIVRLGMSPNFRAAQAHP